MCDRCVTAGKVSDHVAKNEKIQAIKEIRRATGDGLKEAKDFVETLYSIRDDEGLDAVVRATRHHIYGRKLVNSMAGNGAQESTPSFDNGPDVKVFSSLEELFGSVLGPAYKQATPVEVDPWDLTLTVADLDVIGPVMMQAIQSALSAGDLTRVVKLASVGETLSKLRANGRDLFPPSI